MFNLFKSHIIEDNGNFYIRKLTLLGFRYLDINDKYWWLEQKEWNRFDSYIDAINRYKNFITVVEKPKVKIYNIDYAK